MPDDQRTSARSQSLGPYLKSVRESKGLSLRDVEEATDKDVSNAYLSQLENGKISRPSPNILHSLSEAYGVSYEKLMQRAGYVSPKDTRHAGDKHGRAATFSVEHLSAEEEKELLKYLSWYRSSKGKK